MLEALLKPSSLLEILILSVVLYFFLNFIRGTRGAGILKGMVFLFVFLFVGALYVAEILGLVHLKEMMKWIISGSTIALIVIFAPEMRRGLSRLAQSRFLSPLLHVHSSALINELSSAVVKLSKKRIGALVAVERDVGLGEYIENAVKIDAQLTSELLETIFYPGTALHDGAVILQHDRVAAAGCLFPLTDDPTLSKSMGTRHRAAIGLSEESDAIVLVVSEETGKISLCVAGRMTTDLTEASIQKLLHDLYTHAERPTIAVRTAEETKILAKAQPAAGNGPALSRAEGPVSGNGSDKAESPKTEEKKP